MVRALDLQAGILEVDDHRVAQVGVVVGRRDGEIAALVSRLVAEVSTGLVGAGVPFGRDRVDEVEARLRVGLIADRVEDIELGLGPEIGGCRRCRSL